VLSFTDPFLARLHSLYIQEFLPLWTVLTKVYPEMGTSVVFIESVPLLAALATIVSLRRRSPPELVFTTLVTAGLAAMGLWQARWQLNAGAAEVALLIVVIDAWTAGRSLGLRSGLAAAAVALLFLPGGYKRYAEPRDFVATRHIETRDAMMTLARDVAAALRASQPQGDIVLLSSANASTEVGYYGRFRTIGTLYWENAEGLKAAAAIQSARDDAEARRLMHARQVTHVAMISEANFIREGYRLLHPDAREEEIDASFGWRLMTGEPPPEWLEPIPYEVPPELRALDTRVLLFKVR
jgi:hypothetical protein